MQTLEHIVVWGLIIATVGTLVFALITPDYVTRSKREIEDRMHVLWAEALVDREKKWIHDEGS